MGHAVDSLLGAVGAGIVSFRNTARASGAATLTSPEVTMLTSTRLQPFQRRRCKLGRLDQPCGQQAAGAAPRMVEQRLDGLVQIVERGSNPPSRRSFNSSRSISSSQLVRRRPR